MFRSIFKRRGTADQSKRKERASSAAPASVTKVGASQVDAAVPVDLTVDEGMMVISRELSGLARMEVGQAAKERGWATLHRELERHRVRSQSATAGGGAKEAGARGAGAKGAARVGAGPQSRTIRSGNPRWVMISAAAVAVVAVVVSLAAVYGGGGDGPVVVSNPPTTGTVTSVVTSDTTPPDTTVPTGVTTAPTVDTTVPTGNTTPTTSTPTTTGGTTPTSGATPTSDRPVTTDRTTVTTKTPDTTQPPATTTTNETQMATAQREKDAKRVAQALGSEVLLAFQSGSELGDVSSLVTLGARGDVTQMVSRLVNPDGCHVSTMSVNGGTVSVVMTFNDVIPDGQGGQNDVTKRFIATVRVDDDRAVITGISYAGS